MNHPASCGIAALLLLGGLALPAAAAQRTFVASFGDDANPCAIASPCRTFTRAMTQTNPGGEVIVLDSAGYGAFTITQSVSIIAPDGVYAGISVFLGAPDASHGIVVNGVGIEVTLRGLTINGQGGDDGIRIENAGTVFIERVTVANAGNSSNDAGIRVTAFATGARVFVTDTKVRGSAGAGIVSEANATLQVDRSRFEANASVGVGGAAPGGTLTVTNSLVARNQGMGVGVTKTGGSGNWEIAVSRSTIVGNTSHGLAVDGAGSGTATSYRVVIVDNVLRNNLNGIMLSNSFLTATALVGDNRIAGNSGNAIACGGTASMVLIAERNAVVGNGRAFEQGGSCTFESLGNNAARGNAAADTGTITPVTLR